MGSTAIHPYDSVAELINDFYGREVVRIDGDSLVPCDSRTAFVLERILGSSRRPARAVEAAGRLPIGFGGYWNRRFIPIDGGFGESKELSISIPANPSRTDMEHVNRRVGDRKLAQLVAILYFRANGYVIQRPLGNDRDPYHLVAWRSPAVSALAEAGLIVSGCIFDELLNARRMGRADRWRSSVSDAKDLAFILTSSSATQAIKDYGALSQVLGISSTGNGYGSHRLAAMDQVYLCFPLISRRSDRRPITSDPVVGFGPQESNDGRIGLIALEPGRLTVKESSGLGNAGKDQLIERYEMGLKNALLENFRVYEIFDFMEKLNVEFCRDFEDQIFWEFDEKLRLLNVKVIAAELMDLMSEDR